MKRFYISPMVQGPYVAGGNPWCSKVAATLAGTGASVVDIQPEPPTQGWALVVVEAPNHTAVVGDAANDALPDLTMDTTLSVLTSQQRQALINRMQARGLDTTGIGVSTPFREVIRRIGRFNMAGFDENAFDAAVK